MVDIKFIDKQRNEECDLTYLTTDYPELMIVPELQENVTKILVISTHINIDLKLRLSEEFLYFQMERMIQSTIHEVQKHLCMLGTNSFHQLEHSSIHPNALIINAVQDCGGYLQSWIPETQQMF